MAIFTQLTSTTLFIISMAIAITNGMNTNSSSSSGCTQHQGKIQHVFGIENIPKLTQNTDGADKQFILKRGLTNLDSVTLNINNQSCTASSSQSGTCKIDGDSHTGKLIFNIATIKVIVPFKNASFFSGDKCEIEIGKYDTNSHKLTLKINGANFEINPTTTPESVSCRRV